MKSKDIQSPPVLTGNSLRVAVREAVQKSFDINLEHAEQL
jgi:hypothetical protein